jgi:carbamate kinase
VAKSVTAISFAGAPAVIIDFPSASLVFYHDGVRLVVALGGNALLRRGEPLTADNQRRNVRAAARAIAPLAAEHELVISHGNGPQVGLLALETGASEQGGHYPLDVLGAETEGMIGYLIEQELSNCLPGRSLATLLTMVEVDPDDPAFLHPTKPIGPIYDAEQARRMTKERGFTMAPDGGGLRRVVPSPLPKRVLELRAIQWLLDRDVIVICAGGGGIPTVREDEGGLSGVEAVIDKDRAAALLAREVSADLLVLATDVDAVYDRYRRPGALPLGKVTPRELQSLSLDPGSMGPKVQAACDFVESGGQRAVIGALEDIPELVAGTRGTRVMRKR